MGVKGKSLGLVPCSVWKMVGESLVLNSAYIRELKSMSTDEIGTRGCAMLTCD